MRGGERAGRQGKRSFEAPIATGHAPCRNMRQSASTGPTAPLKFFLDCENQKNHKTSGCRYSGHSSQDCRVAGRASDKPGSERDGRLSELRRLIPMGWTHQGAGRRVRTVARSSSSPQSPCHSLQGVSCCFFSIFDDQKNIRFFYILRLMELWRRSGSWSWSTLGWRDVAPGHRSSSSTSALANPSGVQGPQFTPTQTDTATGKG